MKHQTGFYQTSKENDSQPLFYNLIYPDNLEIKASILILHGMEEHSGRYIDFAKYLTAQGFAVLAYDHLGHGKSVKQKDDLGFFQLQKPANKVVDDAEAMADFVEQLYPNIPHFVLGHSMAAFIVRCLLQQANNRFDGAIIVGTGGRLIGIKLLRGYFFLMNKMNPRHRPAFKKLFSKVNNWKFKNEENNDGTNWLSVNVTNRNAFVKDELCGFGFTNNGYFTLFSVYAKATARNWAKNIPNTFPILYVSGEDDPIGNFGKGVKQTFNDMKKDGFKDISMKLYPGFRHEILNEDIRVEVFEHILEWIKLHI